MNPFVTTIEVEKLYTKLKKLGMLGGKILGAGGGWSNFISPRSARTAPKPATIGTRGNFFVVLILMPSSNPHSGQRKGASWSRGIGVESSAFGHDP